MRRDVIRLSYSQILRLRRCGWAWHARHVRRLVPLRRRRPPPVWGDAYHAAAAAVWRSRALLEWLGLWGDDAYPLDDGHADALLRLHEIDEFGLDVEALAAEVSQAAVEACRSVGPEWQVLWLDDEPVVERRLVTPLGEVDGVPVELVTVLDLALVRHSDGRVRVVDHKTTTAWPERVGDALRPDEDLDLDLRDDLQIRLYVIALAGALRFDEGACSPCGGWGGGGPNNGDCGVCGGTGFAPCIEGAHLVRRAHVGTEPPVVRGGRLSRAEAIEATPEQWLTAIRRHHLRVEDYEAELARARLLRWQAWAPVQFTPQSLEQARREVLWAAVEVARLSEREADDVPRSHLPGRWMPFRPGRWSGAVPKDSAECFAWSACAACDWRELCVAEQQGDESAVALLLAGEFAHVDEERQDRAAGAEPSCNLDADEVG